MATNGRRKGLKFENDICVILSRWLAPEYTPALPKIYDLPFRRRSTSIMPLDGHWHGEGDILHKPHSEIVNCFCIECKKIEGWELDGILTSNKWPVWEWWAQAVQQAEKVKLAPLLIFTRNRRPVYVMVRKAEQAWLKVKPVHGAVLNVKSSPYGSVVLMRLDDLARVPIQTVRRRASQKI